VSASDAIRDLLGRYCEYVDAGDFESVGELFAEGAIADDRGREIARGSDAVTAYYRSSVKLYDGSPKTKHLVLNTVFESSVVTRSSFVVLQALDDLPLQPIITGRYLDTFALTQTGPRFSERRFFVDLLGDLSRHLTYEV
jgi:hypothetical protein